MVSLNSSIGSGGSYGTAPRTQRIENGAVAPPDILNGCALGARRIGYGLPCAQCKTYYAADLAECPLCKSPQRVSPIETLETDPAILTQAETVPDIDRLEQERERFLREFNSQQMTMTLPLELPTLAHCNRPESHPITPAPAVVCQGCYEYLQERVDVLEAAMHIDIKEAAQIVYDAVWADPSDPSKTYQNAAQALLTELRRRSGVTNIFGPLQPPVN
ncbi:MAG: hypothetical protein JO356_21375 [Acidobacteria bacterium]|nr:hypothetical protein [Acidobacteriota bacterium]